MKAYLLDTNFAVFALSRPERIPAQVRKSIDAGSVFLSVISYWEVLLKSSKGKLDIGEPRIWWAEALDRLGGTPLSLTAEHISAIRELPAIHADPFDRALMAQAAAENLTLATTDSTMAKYASTRLRILC